ncbi:aminotransferase class V-fold PLP-dependent enzyme [Patescibacteria group bacterium]|nr:aminotransferase class V-fold PLP-dependent enzyme [Patescibacteria group bacterium]
MKKISSLLRDDTLFVIDASQALPHLQIDVQELRCDVLIGTAHKMMADTGLGMMYMDKDLLQELTPAI